jgi:hypothetical protein
LAKEEPARLSRHFEEMGANSSLPFDCSCVLPSFTVDGSITGTSEEAEKKQRRAGLQGRGNNFLRPALLGLSSQEINVCLSDDCAKVKWKSVSKNFLTGQEEFGEILLDTVKTCKMHGQQGLQFVSKDAKGSVLFEVQAEDVGTRDRWVAVLNELLADGAPKAELTAAGTSNKDAYFKMRQAEIEAREKEAKTRREKYAGVGMKYTALAMMSMDDKN